MDDITCASWLFCSHAGGFKNKASGGRFFFSTKDPGSKNIPFVVSLESHGVTKSPKVCAWILAQS